MQLHASFLACMDAFWVLTLLALAAVPLALSLRNVKPGAARPRRESGIGKIDARRRP